MEIVIGLGIAIANNLLKFLVAKFGTLAVQVGLFVITFAAYWLYKTFGANIDWTSYAMMAGSAALWYEIVLKKVWPQATIKAITKKK